MSSLKVLVPSTVLFTSLNVQFVFDETDKPRFIFLVLVEDIITLVNVGLQQRNVASAIFLDTSNVVSWLELQFIEDSEVQPETFNSVS